MIGALLMALHHQKYRWVSKVMSCMPFLQEQTTVTEALHFEVARDVKTGRMT